MPQAEIIHLVEAARQNVPKEKAAQELVAAEAAGSHLPVLDLVPPAG
jgi:hypothetical protein